MTIIQVYVPDSSKNGQEAEEFYSQLKHTVDTAPKKNVLFVIGDFNAIPQQPKKNLPRYRVDLLKNIGTRNGYRAALSKKLSRIQPTEAPTEEEIDRLVEGSASIIRKTTSEILGIETNSDKPWITPEIIDLCVQKRTNAYKYSVDPSPPPLTDEVLSAIKSIKIDKAPGLDGIQSEVLKAGPEELLDIHHKVKTSVWETGTSPDLGRKPPSLPKEALEELKLWAFFKPSPCAFLLEYIRDVP
ncbi:hypothetical protein QYM36_003350 [Artemia franciscana]|uniref:Endonuclease/exonuclease/phosphatase domain-containing protein n=1 Tax=Artemia franciscana TaxID=6661 RepID=A0AA88IB92_ARTSF|nr:hypothetical protein QYM36_003350 [Artemia franciscana]